MNKKSKIKVAGYRKIKIFDKQDVREYKERKRKREREREREKERDDLD